MFESLYFLWLRTELSILNQEFSLTFTRSDVNTCALLQNGYIAFMKLDKFLETVWVLSDLEAGLSQLFLYISSLSKKRDLDPTGICVLQKKPQNKNTQTNKKPKQTPGLTRPGTVRGYWVLLFILPRGNTAPLVQLLLHGPRSPEGTADWMLCWSLVSIISIKITLVTKWLVLSCCDHFSQETLSRRERQTCYFSLSHCCEEKILMGKCHWAISPRIWVISASELTE